MTNFSFFTFFCEIENTDPSKTYLSPRIWKGQLQKVFLDKLPSVNARWWWTALRSLFWHVIVSWLGKLIWRVLSLNIRDHIHALHVVGDAEAESVVGRGGHLRSAGAQVSLSQPREETRMAGFWTKFLVGQRVTQAHNLVRAIIKDGIKNCKIFTYLKILKDTQAFKSLHFQAKSINYQIKNLLSHLRDFSTVKLRAPSSSSITNSWASSLTPVAEFPVSKSPPGPENRNCCLAWYVFK